jgi:restriction endonuclease Mrr
MGFTETSEYVVACLDDERMEEAGPSYYFCVTRTGDIHHVCGSERPDADGFVDSLYELEHVRLDILDKRTPTKVYQAAEFDKTCRLVVLDFEAISEELMAEIARNPKILADMHWRNFEMLLDAIFKNQGYVTELGRGSHDGGVDIRLIQKDSIGTMLTLVQAKRRHPGHPIELDAVQALHGVVDDQRAHRGLFVTTSRYRPGAREFAERQNQRLVLADSQHIADWCRDIVARRRL